jgi:hypothetical protein
MTVITRGEIVHQLKKGRSYIRGHIERCVMTLAQQVSVGGTGRGMKKGRIVV